MSLMPIQTQHIGLDHVSPETEKAADVANANMTNVKETNSRGSLQAVIDLCDGTNANTGKSNDIICNLELELGRPLQLVHLLASY